MLGYITVDEVRAQRGVTGVKMGDDAAVVISAGGSRTKAVSVAKHHCRCCRCFGNVLKKIRFTRENRLQLGRASGSGRLSSSAQNAMWSRNSTS